jgi:hypothetical protein
MRGPLAIPVGSQSAVLQFELPECGLVVPKQNLGVVSVVFTTVLWKGVAVTKTTFGIFCFIVDMAQ